jgi:hypothetical protein
MSQDVRFGVQSAQRKAYVTPQVRRIGLSLAEVAAGTICWDGVSGQTKDGNCNLNQCFGVE